MLLALIVALITLWLLGYIAFPGFFIPNVILFTINAHPITLWNLLIFLVILVIATSLPSPLREILFVMLIIWAISVLGFIAFIGLPNLLLVAIIAGLLVYILQGRKNL